MTHEQAASHYQSRKAYLMKVARATALETREKEQWFFIQRGMRILFNYKKDAFTLLEWRVGKKWLELTLDN